MRGSSSTVLEEMKGDAAEGFEFTGQFQVLHPLGHHLFLHFLVLELDLLQLLHEEAVDVRLVLCIVRLDRLLLFGKFQIRSNRRRQEKKKKNLGTALGLEGREFAFDILSTIFKDWGSERRFLFDRVWIIVMVCTRRSIVMKMLLVMEVAGKWIGAVALHDHGMCRGMLLM